MQRRSVGRIGLVVLAALAAGGCATTSETLPSPPQPPSLPSPSSGTSCAVRQPLVDAGRAGGASIGRPVFAFVRRPVVVDRQSAVGVRVGRIVEWVAG